MSLQPLFIKLIHLLNHIYSDRICHILSVSRALLWNNAFSTRTCGDVEPRAASSPPYLSLTMGWNIVKRDSHSQFYWTYSWNFPREKPIFLFDGVPPKIVLIAASFFFFFLLRISVFGEQQTYTPIIRWIAAVSVILINPRPAPRNGCVLVSLKLCSQTSEAKEFSFWDSRPVAADLHTCQFRAAHFLTLWIICNCEWWSNT